MNLLRFKWHFTLAKNCLKIFLHIRLLPQVIWFLKQHFWSKFCHKYIFFWSGRTVVNWFWDLFYHQYFMKPFFETYFCQTDQCNNSSFPVYNFVAHIDKLKRSLTFTHLWCLLTTFRILQKWDFCRRRSRYRPTLRHCTIAVLVHFCLKTPKLDFSHFSVFLWPNS